MFVNRRHKTVIPFCNYTNGSFLTKALQYYGNLKNKSRNMLPTLAYTKTYLKLKAFEELPIFGLCLYFQRFLNDDILHYIF